MIREAHPSDLPAIAALAAARHVRSQGAEKWLSPRWLTQDGVLEVLPEDPQGWVCIEHGRLVASMLWRPRGQWAYCELPGTVGHPDRVADLYAVASAAWVELDYSTHAITLPVTDRGISQRLIELSFGIQASFGVRPLGDGGGVEPRLPSGMTIERGGVKALDGIEQLGLALARQHEAPPVFSPRALEFYEGLRESYRELLEGGNAHMLVARMQGEVIGMITWLDAPEEHFFHPDNAEIDQVVVLAPWRGRGVGRILTTLAMREMARAGHPAVNCDWRSTNLSAARFWPGVGFLTAAQRYARVVSLTAFPD